MQSNRSRRALALASALAVGSTALVAAGPAQASLPGSGSVLTTSDGTDVLKFFGGASGTLSNPYDTMTDAAWSPDGSRAAYIDPLGGISSIRYNGLDGGDVLWMIDPADNVERSSVSWRGNGSSIVWAERSTGGKWGIRVSPSSSGYSYELTTDATKHYLNPDGGVQGLVVFQRQDDNGSGQPTGTPAVMLYNPANQQITQVDADGSNPAISPDGKSVAFVRGGQIIVSDLAGDNEVVVADVAAGTDNPTWSPDGNRIAFNRGSAVYTAAADGSQHAAPSAVANATGEPAYQPRHQDRAVRLYGANRFTTATAASQSHWATNGVADQREQAQVAVLSRSDTFADALAGSALAAAKGGPLLMTPPTSLNADTANELKRVLAPGATVYVLGSEGALSATVFNAVQSLGFTPKRLAGSDRFSTSVAIANEINPNPDLVLLATGMNFPDALAAGAAAGSYNGPNSPSAVVVLSQDAKMPAATKSYLDALPADQHYLFGIGRYAAQAALAYDSSALQVWGENRFETAYAAAYVFFGGENYVGLATGMDWPDALSGGALMGRLNGPLLLTLGTSSSISAEATWRLDESSGSVHTGLIFGSSAVVASSQQTQLGTWIGGPLGSLSQNNSTDVGFAASPLKVGGTTALRESGSTAGDSVMRTPEEAAAAAEQFRDRPAKG